MPDHRCVESSCGDCDIACSWCARPARIDDVIVTVDGDSICRRCRDQFYWRCDDCEEWTSYEHDRCGNGCGDEYGLILPYEYKPEPEFHGTGPLYLGLELEVHAPYDPASDGSVQVALQHLKELGYIKADGSVDDGFEIVTHPMSYDWALANFPWTMLPELEQQGCDTSDATGLHVHVSRDGFDSAGHAYRWMKLLYRNRPQITRLARRSSPAFAAFTDDDRQAIKDYAKGVRGGRNRAINTANDDTFEVRVFASSLDVGDVQAALALTAASIEYTRSLSVPHIHAGGWGWPAFTQWVAAHPEYTPLRDQMDALIPTS